MARDRRDVASALTQKGFKAEVKNRDHDYFFFESQGLLQAVSTKLSRGTSYRTLGDALLAKIRRQLHLTKDDFDRFVDCPLERAEYEEILRTKGVLRPPLEGGG